MPVQSVCVLYAISVKICRNRDYKAKMFREESGAALLFFARRTKYISVICFFSIGILVLMAI